jgi:response regulator RpfG family c-di-GMP phosphodiesterase
MHMPFPFRRARPSSPAGGPVEPDATFFRDMISHANAFGIPVVDYFGLENRHGETHFENMFRLCVTGDSVRFVRYCKNLITGAKAHVETMQRLVFMAECKHQETGGHLVRIGLYAALLAWRLKCGPRFVHDILYAASLHDIGKVGVPGAILAKPGALTAQERAQVERHAEIGRDMLAGSEMPVIVMAEEIAWRHHENFDGSGYPCGLAGEGGIKVESRIVRLADFFDALTSRRAYKEPCPIDRTVEMIRAGSGRDFDPAVVRVFLENLDHVVDIRGRVGTL